MTERMGYIKVPTGWGKTFLAKHLMRQYYEDGKVILFLVSSNNPLLVQTFFRDEGKTPPLFPDSLLLAFGHDCVTAVALKRRISSRKGGLVIFASLQTLNTKRNREVRSILSEHADLVIIDEVHNFIFTKGNEFIDSVSGDAKVLGMTATPFQGVVGNVKLVEDISCDMRKVFSKTLPQCIMDGDLCKLSYTIIRSDQDIRDIFKVKKPSDLNGEQPYLDCGSRERIESIARRTHLAKRVYDERIDRMKSGKKPKTLIFCAPVRKIVQGFGEDERKVTTFHAKLCSAIFNGELEDRFDPEVSFDNRLDSGQFKDSVYLSSELPKSEQREIIEAFRTIGKPPYTLCTVGMLIEGFDFPDLENLILLRPTLSMRLFEQEIGRVTRKPKGPDKVQGNIIEVLDDIDSLYDAFGDEVFNEKAIERIQMLRPENRIEEWFTEGGNIEAVECGKIEVTQIDFRRKEDRFLEKTVQIPPTDVRTKYFIKVLSIIEHKQSGKLRRERERMMEMALRFKLDSLYDAEQIARITGLLDRLKREAAQDEQLSDNCRENKQKLLEDVKLLLHLRSLTYLKYYNTSLDDEDKRQVLKILGFVGGIQGIDEHRLECLEAGYGINLEDLHDRVDGVKQLFTQKGPFKLRGTLFGNDFLEMLREYIYWTSCFIPDDPEISALFESKDWNYRVRRYFITPK